MYKNIRIKKDGTYVIDFRGLPFHVTEDYPTKEQYGEEMTFAKVKEYADTHQDEVSEYQEPVFTLDPETEKRMLIANKEKEKTDIMANILADIDVEANKEKLKTVMAEIAELKADINPAPTPTEFTVTKEQEAVLKPNTKYTITHNVNSIKAGDGINGVRGISITYTLEYTVDGSTVRTITSPSWISKINTIIPDTFELTTGEDTGDHKLILRVVGGHYGSLTPAIEFYVQEVTE